MRKAIELNSEQLASLASPARSEVFVAIRSLRKASIREVAEYMRRSPESLYYHINALLKAGLIQETDKRPTKRKPEAIYSSTADDFRLPDLQAHPELEMLTRPAVAAGLPPTAADQLARGARGTATTSAETDSQTN